MQGNLSCGRTVPQNARLVNLGRGRIARRFRASIGNFSLVEAIAFVDTALDTEQREQDLH
jgi:hypothetical protein